MALLVRAAVEGLLERAMLSMALDIVRFVLVENFLKGLDRLLAVLVKPVFSALRMRAVHVSLALLALSQTSLGQPAAYRVLRA